VVDFGSSVERIFAYVVSLGMLGATVAPGLGDPTDDSYPLSTYPMFARPKAKTNIPFAEGIDDVGHAIRLGPEVIANDEAMQAVHTLRRAINGGPERLEQLCLRVAERTAADKRLERVVTVRLAEGQFDSIGYFLGATEPETRTTHHECAVQRSP
jgi:hypothetical protein